MYPFLNESAEQFVCQVLYWFKKYLILSIVLQLKILEEMTLITVNVEITIKRFSKIKKKRNDIEVWPSFRF